MGELSFHMSTTHLRHRPILCTARQKRPEVSRQWVVLLACDHDGWLDEMVWNKTSLWHRGVNLDDAAGSWTTAVESGQSE